MTTLSSCPFCDEQPSFTDVELKDERRYAQKLLQCCSIEMSASLSFGQYKGLTDAQIDHTLRSELVRSWNHRAPQPLGVAQPFAWVIGRDNNANDKGFIDAMAWSEGEFTTPVYLAPQPASVAQPKPDREGARLSNWLADYSHDLMEDGNCDQEAAEVAKAAQWIADALSPVPSTSRSAQQPKVSDLESVYSALAQAQDCIGGETPEDISDEEAREDTLNKVREAMRVIEAMTTPSDGAIYAAASRHMGREWAEDLDKIIDRVSSLPSTACAIPETGDYEGTEDDLIASSVSSTVSNTPEGK